MADTETLFAIDLDKLKLDVLEPILESYVANLEAIRKEEGYKWEAVKCFKDNWNPDADNYAEMLAASLAKAGNLLTGYNYFPFAMIRGAAEINPSYVKRELEALLDGEDSLRERVEHFAEAMDAENNRNNQEAIAEGKSIHSYQDTRAMSVYMTFAHPEQYYLYKTGMFRIFADAIKAAKPGNKYDKLVYYYRLLDALLSWIEQDHPEVVDVSDALLSDELKSADPKHHLMMQDIVYYAADYITKEKENGIAKDNSGDGTDGDSKPVVEEILENDNPNYWWITAKPSYFTWDALEVGESVSYTAFNNNGNKRRIFHYFEQAKPGDFVVGYSTYPDKYIKCFGKVLAPLTDGFITVVKTEEADNKVDYATLLADPVVKQMEYIRTNPTGTIFKLTQQEYERIYELAMKPASDIEPYGDKDFLNEVYLEKDELAKLKELIARKKNLILQGAPGTGKTFAAKRLAYDIMGCKDDARVQMVQFHQNTAYDDMVCGYRPTIDGSFLVKNGVFVDFCRKAQKHPEDAYFFIIDEINRASISKVFGELLMLIEADHRGDEVLLPVSGEAFSVPENVYLIGMMNTADRGLALIDYALRRRFAFYEMKPALENERFIKDVGSNKAMKKLVEAVKLLNKDIEADTALGKGFCIGHSYFCGAGDSVAAAESVVDYELVPLVEEYWFDDPQMAAKQIERLRDAVK